MQIIKSVERSGKNIHFGKGDNSIVDIFRTQLRVIHLASRTKSAHVRKVIVDIDSEHTWVPADILESLGINREKKAVELLMAKGKTVTRDIGFAIVRVHDIFTVDEVVFAEKRDRLRLGARTLAGLNLRIDSRQKKLVAAGPLPAAAMISARC